MHRSRWLGVTRWWACGALVLLAAACTAAPAAPPAAQPSGAAPSAAAAAPSGTVAPAPTAAGREPVHVEVGVVSLTLGFWPTWVAEAEGFFADEGVQNETSITRSMPGGLSALTGGSIQLMGGSLTAAVQATERGADLVFVAANQADPAYSLIGRPELSGVAELRGKTVAVSALNGGDTVVLRKMLAARGLREGDVDFTLAGGTPERYAALASGGAQAAMLLQPQDFQALAQGYKRLMVSSEVLQDPVQRLDHAARMGARQRRRAGARLRAHVRACRWLNDPANREAAIAVGAQRTNTDVELVRQTYALYFEQLGGGRVIPVDPVVSLSGVRAVLDDMVAAGDLPAPAPPPEKYVDGSYLERARRD